MNSGPRKPRVVDVADVIPEIAPEDEPGAWPIRSPGETRAAARTRSRWGWWSVLLSATAGLVTLASGLWLARYIEIALAREDALGWIAAGLMGAIVVALAALTLREGLGWLRLARLEAIRVAADQALAKGDLAGQNAVARRITRLFAARVEVRWALKRFDEHLQDVHDPGDLLALAERDILAPLDQEATRAILGSAKRVSVVTALSPSAFLAVAFVIYENLRLLRSIAGVYGGRPGSLGALKLLRMVVTHVVATGGVAVTDDLFGQFLGQDLLRRVSARMGEGAFNGALTARVGVTALGVCRPLPFRAVPPVRLRSVLAEVWRKPNPPPRPEA